MSKFLTGDIVKCKKTIVEIKEVYGNVIIGVDDCEWDSDGFDLVYRPTDLSGEELVEAIREYCENNYCSDCFFTKTTGCIATAAIEFAENYREIVRALTGWEAEQKKEEFKVEIAYVANIIDGAPAETSYEFLKSVEIESTTKIDAEKKAMGVYRKYKAENPGVKCFLKIGKCFKYSVD
ncbi:MAG: hypothetical protein FWE25_03405 [Lachnospiraceae bacterium]|nr:hypothetical protein [Lachnospiraceae bacterium]